MLHAWYIIAVTPDPTYEPVQQDAEAGTQHVTYYHVQQGGPTLPRGYGTVRSAPNQQFPTAKQGQGFVQPQPPQGQEAGPSAGDVPPSYTDAVKGDNKLQHP